MNNIIIKLKQLVVIVFMLSFIGVFSQNKKPKKPNVLVIYTDDHRASGIHKLGGMDVQTPNLDNLATEGIAFKKTYLMGAFTGATCIASRAMLHSGRQLFTLEGQGRNIPSKDTTMGETFKNAGYNTFMVGKWHNDNASLIRSFDDGEKVMGRGVYLVDHFRMPFHDWDSKGDFKKEDAYLLVYDENGNTVKRAVTKEDKRGPIGTEENGPHTSEVFAEHASDYIKNYKKKDPFFMYVAFHAPHDPRQAPKAYKDMYPPSEIVLPPSYMPQHPFDNGHMVLRDEELATWPRTEEVSKQQLSDYYAIITHLDVQIGKVIKALKESGAYENTIIVLAGDSGLAVGNHGLMGKQNIYDEDGIHVPLIISGGLVQDKGREINAFSYIHDIFPTVCELAGVKIPASVNGKSLAPIINNEVANVRNSTYHAYRQFQRAYRKNAYKLIEYVRAKDFNKKTGEFEAGSRVTQLFNIEKDPWETTDLSFFPEYFEILAEMRTEMKAKAIELGDKKESINEQFDFWDYY